jgi:hypothetical protein
MRKLSLILAGLLPALAALLAVPGVSHRLSLDGADRDPQIGQSFRVPYRLTDTNHFLVRVRINGKGPFNFLVDSGAPALYVATETAAKIGLKPVRGKFWTSIDQLNLEGGAWLRGIKARVEDPFQLVGMNALGLPGASIDGILGFTILARFRLEIDPTRDFMVWTRLDHTPPDPPIPQHVEGTGPPAELSVMNALGSLAKGLAFFMGKQPAEERHPRGFLGLQWAETRDTASGQLGVRIVQVTADSPAAKGGIKTGDYVIRACGQSVTSLKTARAALSAIRAGNRIELALRRGDEERNARELTVTLTAGEGF